MRLNKKILCLLLILGFTFNMPVMAFSFKKKNAVNPLDLNEKVEYVNMEFIDNFQDPYLIYYICEAIKNNHDVRKASWQVEEYRQNVKYSFGKELPSLSVGANYAGLHIPRLGGNNNFNIQKNAFILPFILNYEPDFLLKNRDKTKSIKKAYEASKFEEKAVYISLVTDVATLYINIMQYDSLIADQEQIAAIKLEQLSREAKKYDRGVIDNSQLNSVKKEYEDVKNDLEDLKKSLATSLNQFAVLIGALPNCNIKRSEFESFEYHCPIPPSVSSDVIFSRPDVLAAEAKLEKANIDIRVARKEFLPTFNIIGIWAFNTIVPGTFFSWDSSIAAIIAGATQDIFKGGMKVANLKINKAIYEQMFEEYKQTDLEAVKEVNNALCVIKYDTQIDKNTINKLRIQIKDYSNSRNKFSQGVISFPDLLKDEEKLLNMKQVQTKTKTTRLVNYLTLYKAVGGKL